jgi:uncharacterized protein YndB with AHSA1/START domain
MKKNKAVKKKAIKKKAVAKKAAPKAKGFLVEEKRFIQASPEAVFRTLSQAYEWREWLCQEAKFASRPKEKWEAKWEDGYKAWGTILALVAPKRLVLAWSDARDPRPSRAEFILKPHPKGTELSLQHSDFGKGPQAAKSFAGARRAWVKCLENLVSILETGIDLRIARRPMMGINFDFLSPEAAKELGVKPGYLKLTDLVPGLSAEKAGLRKGDVLLTVDRKEIVGWEKIGPVLGKHQAGDKIEVVYLRDGKKQSLVLELSPRKMEDIPWNPKAVVAKARQAYQPIWEEMEKTLSGVSEEEAVKPEAPGKWSVKEVLAHLSVGERDGHQWMVWDILGEVPGTQENPTTAPERLKAAIAVTPGAMDLFARYKKDVEESWDMFLALRPEVLENKARYRRMAQSLLFYAEHAKGHLKQIQRVLATIRKT